MMTGPRRQLAIAEPAQLTAQGLRADRDRELVPDPLRQIEQPPAHHAMRRRDRSVLDDLRQCPAVLLVKQWRRARTEEHTPELKSQMRISYAVYSFKQKNPTHTTYQHTKNDQTETYLQEIHYQINPTDHNKNK